MVFKKPLALIKACEEGGNELKIETIVRYKYLFALRPELNVSVKNAGLSGLKK